MNTNELGDNAREESSAPRDGETAGSSQATGNKPNFSAKEVFQNPGLAVLGFFVFSMIIWGAASDNGGYASNSLSNPSGQSASVTPAQSARAEKERNVADEALIQCKTLIKDTALRMGSRIKLGYRMTQNLGVNEMGAFSYGWYAGSRRDGYGKLIICLLYTSPSPRDS